MLMTLWLTAAKVSVHHRLTTYYVGPKGKKNKIMAEACEVVIHLEVARNQCTEREDKKYFQGQPLSDIFTPIRPTCYNPTNYLL